MNLYIRCKGVANVSFYNCIGEVALEEVDMSFLEYLDSSVLVSNHNNDKLLDAMDVDEIEEWLQNKKDSKC